MPDDDAAFLAASRIARLQAIVEPIAKGTLATLAVCYGIGLLIKKIYLARWSTAPATFAHVEYVLSGALFLFLASLGVAFWSLFNDSWLKLKRVLFREAYRNQKGAIRTAYARVVLVLFAESVFLVFILSFICSDALGSVNFFLTLFFVVGLPAVYFFARQGIVEMWVRFATGQTVTGDAGMKLFFRVVLLLTGLCIYVSLIFPNVVQAYGGGKHIRVEIRASDEGAKTLQDVGFVPKGTTSHLFVAELISRDDEYLTLVARTTKSGARAAVQVRRDQVTSLVTLSEPPPERLAPRLWFR